MTEPHICCICPYHLPQYVERARVCFDSQTYPHKTWVEWDTSQVKLPIGTIRNQLIQTAVAFKPDLIAHFDHDDWSAPNRLAEQVKFMESSGAPVVGYSDMPFYDEVRDRVLLYDSRNPNYALGTSLMYRREFWEAHPFPDQNDEDTTWQNAGVAQHVRSCSSLFKVCGCPEPDGPRMFATIHKGNTSPKAGARFQVASAELEAAVRTLLQSSFVAQSR